MAVRFAIRAVHNEDGTFTIRDEQGGQTPDPPATIKPDRPGSKDEVYLVHCKAVPALPVGKLTAEQKDAWLRDFEASVKRSGDQFSVQRISFSS